MAAEEPKYEVIATDGNVEIRRYAPMLIAETEVEGDMDEASRKGFRLIADFIFGNNQDPASDQNAKVEMTAPVTVEPSSAKISMTAPVTAEPQDSDQDMRSAKMWRIHFVMPAQYTLKSIPKPMNEAVILREIPEKYFVVYKYSGLNTLNTVQENAEKAIQWAKANALSVIGVPRLSRYDPPWTLPMFRRNEIMVEIAGP